MKNEYKQPGPLLDENGLIQLKSMEAVAELFARATNESKKTQSNDSQWRQRRIRQAYAYGRSHPKD
jgi:hypothetical protein